MRISELAEEFGVTTETVRRDVDELTQKGLVDRTYGGAAVTSLGSEPTIDVRASIHREERTRIANHARSLVQNDEVLMIDAGSTTTGFATRLVVSTPDAASTALTVITNSISVARTLGAKTSIRTVLCPGDYDAREAAVFGAPTLDFLRRFRANTAVIGAGGITCEGVSEVYSEASWVKREMLERVNRRILLIDSSKFGVNHLEQVCGFAQLTDLVTDQQPPDALSNALRQCDVTLHVAG